MNNWSFTGNIGKDAIQRGTDKPVVSFSVAVKAGYGDRESTTWANCSLWGKRGESLLGYLKQGTQVAVVGEVSMEEYETQGGKRQALRVNVSDITLLGKKQDDKKPSAPNKNSYQAPADIDESLPF